MLLNNFYNIFLSGAFNTRRKARNTQGTEYIAYGNQVNAQAALFGDIGTFNTSPTGGNGVVFGSGTSTPTMDDFKFESYITSGINVTSQKTTDNTSNENVITHSVVFTIVNKGSSEVTITEVGYVGSLSPTIGGTVQRVLYDRTLLDTPLTIPVGGVGQLTYTITVNLPVFPTE